MKNGGGLFVDVVNPLAAEMPRSAPTQGI